MGSLVSRAVDLSQLGLPERCTNGNVGVFPGLGALITSVGFWVFLIIMIIKKPSNPILLRKALTAILMQQALSHRSSFVGFALRPCTFNFGSLTRGNADNVGHVRAMFITWIWTPYPLRQVNERDLTFRKLPKENLNTKT